MTLRISATLLSTPLIRMNFACVTSAMIRANVVLPVPGGPEKITEGNRSASMARATVCQAPGCAPGRRVHRASAGVCAWQAVHYRRARLQHLRHLRKDPARAKLRRARDAGNRACAYPKEGGFLS